MVREGNAQPLGGVDVEWSILVGCSIPISLVIPTAKANAREGWRRFLHGTLESALEFVSQRRVLF